MTSPTNESILAPLIALIVNQLWQVTITLVIVGLLTRRLRHKRSHAAYLLWLLADQQE